MVVAQDSEWSDDPLASVNLGEEEMTEEQMRLVHDILKMHKWIVESGSLGKAQENVHVIAIGESTPVHSHLCRIVTGWEEELKEKS